MVEWPDLEVELHSPDTVERPRCPLCGENAPRPLFRPRRSPGPVVQCRHCGLVYVFPIEQDGAIIRGPVVPQGRTDLLTGCNLEALAGCWELRYLPEREAEWPAIRRNAENALRRLERHRPPPGRLLDLGCGWGHFLTVAREHGWEPYGVEPLAGHALYARARTGATVVTDVLREDTFPPAFFDAVTAFQVFEHLPDPAGDLERLHRMLKPGGVILIEVPNIATWSVHLLRQHHRHFVPDHLTFFSPRTLAALLQRKGFRVLECYRPTRWMTLRHLLLDWVGRPLPDRLRRSLGQRLRKSGLERRIVPVNGGDIIAVMGQKGQSWSTPFFLRSASRRAK